MDATTGLINATLLDGRGKARDIGWAEVEEWNPGEGTLWLNLDRTSAEVRRWMRADSGLDELACDAMLAEETRPRAVAMPPGAVVILRGINLNPDTDPEDMVTVRLWSAPYRIITLQRSRVRAVDDIRALLDTGAGPRDPGEFLAEMAERLTERMEPFIADLEDSVDELDDLALDGTETSDLATKLTRVRRSIILLRRHIAPQRDAFTHLAGLAVPWLGDSERRRLREMSERVNHFVEELDSGRERALITQDQLDHRMNERMNRTIYLLSLVSGMFLPLTFIAGLMGMNVGGIPGGNSAIGFLGVLEFLVLVAIGILMLYRRLKWL